MINSVLILLFSVIFYLIAYQTYGKFIAHKIFRINPDAICPSQEFNDKVDYVPTNKFILFGHHFTSIAGLGPIVGPSVAIIWGWGPAILWVLFGSVLIGSIHDFGSMVVSLRSKGKSIGDVCQGIINHRVRILFLLLIFFAVLIVIAVFALIIAILFKMYPQSVIPVFLQIPIAMALGHLIYAKNKNPILMGIFAVILMYATIVWGAYNPVQIPVLAGLDPVVLWIVILLIYAFIASTLPVQMLLQPRDYINSYQLLIAMAMLFLGVFLTHPEMSAPVFVANPVGAPAIVPGIFVIIACGAVSGFHSLVSSGTSSKQCDNESNAMFVSYGSMLTEGVLAILVIIAIGAGLGLGLPLKEGGVLTGADAFGHQYVDWNSANGLSAKLNAFVCGASNIVKILGMPDMIVKSILGVFLVSFAATTLDSATRIQRYVVSELADSLKFSVLTNKYFATLVAVLSAFVLAFYNGSGKGALVLWPLFGTVNQLLAALSLFVVTIYLYRKRIPCVYSLIPMFFMIVITAWAMKNNLCEFFSTGNWLLFTLGVIVSVLEGWMIVEGMLVIFSRQNSDVG